MRPESAHLNEKIMVNGRIHLPSHQPASVEVQRGMKIVVTDGKEVGFVGGVVVNSHSDEVTCILLCHLPVTAVYRLIPIHLIARVEAETIYLNMQFDDLETLAAHSPI
ncbi:MAG: hypothetical protein DWQ04_31410 [Chloroflexi bacterium]|nr:MAG: hypothetical protein DWQ04_31410 [Chloroflexota bacterium]